MIYSMTGFASVKREIDQGVITLELRSVNSRYLDLIFRIVEELRAAEPQLREAIGGRVSRGKLECRVNFQPARAAPVESRPNESVLRQLGEWQTAVRRSLPEAAGLTVAEILHWPGVFDEQATDRQTLQGECLALARSALEDLLATRAREGAKLETMIRGRVSAMRELIAQVEPRIPAVLAEYQDKLTTRLREAMASGEEERIRQEVGLFAARIDIAEELTRLTAHLNEVERVLDKGGVVGKRLDFIMQELNREANTMASKSMATDLTAIAVELKLLIEQVREQVQNLE